MHTNENDVCDYSRLKWHKMTFLKALTNFSRRSGKEAAFTTSVSHFQIFRLTNSSLLRENNPSYKQCSSCVSNLSFFPRLYEISGSDGG